MTDRSKHLLSQKKSVLIGIICIGIMVAVFSVSQTLGRTLKSKIINCGTEENIIMLQEGADAPMFSILSPETYKFVKTVPHIHKENGKLIITRCLQLASLVLGHFTMVRGVDPTYYKMYDQYRLIEGRLPANKNEVIIGSLLPTKVKKKFKIGDTITFEGKQWKIVGIFEDKLTVMGSGIVAKLEDLQETTGRDSFSYISLRADAPKNMEIIRQYIKKTYDALLMETPEVPGVIVEPETKYYLNEAEAINPLVMFLNLVNILYLIVGTLIIYNIADSIYPVKKPYPRKTSGLLRGSKRTITLLCMSEILAIALIGGIFGTIVTLLLRYVSVNFMMMTIYIKVGITTILMGIFLISLLALFSAALPIKRSIVNLADACLS